MSREPNPTDGTGIEVAYSILASSSKNEPADQPTIYATTAWK